MKGDFQLQEVTILGFTTLTRQDIDVPEELVAKWRRTAKRFWRHQKEMEEYLKNHHRIEYD